MSARIITSDFFFFFFFFFIGTKSCLHPKGTPPSICSCREGPLKSLRKVKQINKGCFVCVPQSVCVCVYARVICMRQNLHHSISGVCTAKVSLKPFYSISLVSLLFHREMLTPPLAPTLTALRWPPKSTPLHPCPPPPTQ